MGLLHEKKKVFALRKNILSTFLIGFDKEKKFQSQPQEKKNFERPLWGKKFFRKAFRREKKIQKGLSEEKKM